MWNSSLADVTIYRERQLVNDRNDISDIKEVSNMKIFMSMSSLVLITLVTMGCESRTSGDVYSREQAQRAFSVDEGRVIYVRPVEIEGSATGLGAVAGGAMGFVVGSAIGSGSGRNVATVAGAIAGAATGAAIEEKATHRAGLEITVQLDNSQVLAIVQAADKGFDIGDRVRVLRRPDGSARVVQ